MQLTKLEINGFKSFAKRTELIFESGITGILGPNGCGKSNISDAFRFVLGEQSARALRGKKVEDFIFGGTEKRRPLSYCEVAMHFDNSDGGLLSPYTEVVVSRRAYRSGESEYFINNSPCRLKDINELFRDTGIGKDGYSIIGQGRVGEILSDRSNDRREVFEEAAGVMKYRSRKEEAERKLANTTKNLLRLDDIMRELEARLEPLRVQSEKAIEYFKLREELRDIEINLFLYQYDKSTERIKQLSEAITQFDSAIEQADAEERAYSAGCSEAEDLERRLSVSISETSQNLVTLSTAVESGAGNEKLIAERISALKKDIERRLLEIKRLSAIIENNAARKEELDKLLASTETGNIQLEHELESAASSLAALEAEINEKEELFEDQKQSMMDAMNQLADAKSRISRLEAMRTSLTRRQDEIANERKEFEVESLKLEAELSEEESAVNDIKAEQTAIEITKSASIKKANDINQKIYSASMILRKAEDELNAIRSRTKVLVEMKRAHEGYYASVRRLLNDAERNPQLKARIHGVVAELMSVPSEYETAIEMSLGAALQNIVVPTEQDAKAIISYLRERDYGRATLLPVSAMRSRLLTRDELDCSRIDGCFGVASDLVGYSPAYRNVIENLLGRTVIVRDIDVGIQINRRSKSAFRIATLKGDIMNPGGSMTGGSVQKREFSLLGREREIEELAINEQAVIDRTDEIKKQLETLRSELDRANAGVSEYADALRKCEVLLASHSEKADIIKKYAEKNREQLIRLDLESSRITDAISDIDVERSEAEAAESSISRGNDVTNDDIKRTREELNALRSRLQEANDESARLKVQLMAATKEQSAVNADLVRIDRETESYKAGIKSELNAINEAERNIASLDAEQSKIMSKLSFDRKQFDTISDELRLLEEERAQRLHSLDELRVKRDNITNQLSEMRERRHRSELNLNRLQIDLNNLCDSIWKDYELTYDNAQSFRRDIAVTQTHIRVDELRKAIRSLGEVNTSSVEDYREVKERYDDLSVQCNDLRKAEADLNELIAKLTVTMENEFREQFALIQQNFSQTFSELFHGGRAELVLSDKSDVLNCNIDIIAQPPGKRLQLLTLLSGGEQALTAIALLFAILKLKPAAFCILDEIDTSLDEANVDNFADYLREYSRGTQFILITHRKGAMAVCNSLYGVSMEEKGVSSLVSAKFNDA
ncbi:MAG: chromosome segregation protein SMC [Christensenellaceae bacterium]|nr:chromosome segregation protein SMC [Christensenellaceae bacterium]